MSQNIFWTLLVGILVEAIVDSSLPFYIPRAGITDRYHIGTDMIILKGYQTKKYRHTQPCHISCEVSPLGRLDINRHKVCQGISVRLGHIWTVIVIYLKDYVTNDNISLQFHCNNSARNRNHMVACLVVSDTNDISSSRSLGPFWGCTALLMT